MNIDLKSDKLSYTRPVFRRRFTKEETAEVIVPDALPDILRILDTDGQALLRSKDSDTGRVTVTGLADLTVLYVPESGAGVKRLAVSIPMELSCEGGEIMPDSLIVASLSLTGADARTVNPRKIVVRAEMACDAVLYAQETMYNTAPREREGVYFRCEKRTVRLPVSVNEKTAVFTDEVRLPEDAPAIGEILRTCTVLTTESAKAVGSRAVVKGAAVTDVLYEARDGGICRQTFSSPFSQIVDTDAVGEAADFDVVPALTGVYVTRSLMDGTGAEALSLEYHAAVQCTAFADLVMEQVTDAYSTHHPMALTASECAPERLLAREAVSDTVNVSVPVEGRASAVHAVTARITSYGVRRGEEGCVFTASAVVTVIYSDSGGELLSASRRAELERDLGSDGPVVTACVAGEAYTSVSDGTIEVRVPVELTVSRIQREELTRVESLELDEEAAIDTEALPALSVTRRRGRGLWELAKEHLSTPELILAASGFEDGADPDADAVLLIPRAK